MLSATTAITLGGFMGAVIVIVLSLYQGKQGLTGCVVNKFLES